MKIKELNEGVEFLDSEIEESCEFKIVEDHVYIITNNVDIVVVVNDMGNTHGKVIFVANFVNINNLQNFKEQDWKAFLNGLNNA